MNKMSYREILAEALTPKPADPDSHVIVMKDIRFTPSAAARQKAAAIRARLRAERSSLADAD